MKSEEAVVAELCHPCTETSNTGSLGRLMQGTKPGGKRDEHTETTTPVPRVTSLL